MQQRDLLFHFAGTKTLFCTLLPAPQLMVWRIGVRRLQLRRSPATLLLLDLSRLAWKIRKALPGLVSSVACLFSMSSL